MGSRSARGSAGSTSDSISPSPSTAPSATLRRSRIVKTCSSPGWRMESLIALPSGMTLDGLMLLPGADFSTWYTGVIRASRSASPASGSVSETSGTCGHTSPASSPSASPNGASSRTFLGTFHLATEMSDESWSWLVMRLRKDSSRRLRLALPIGDKGSTYSPDDSKGTMWPTPDGGVSTRINQGGKEGRVGRRRPCLANLTQNPAMWEWLMGFPIGWTDLKPLATPSYQTWRRSHGERCEES